MSTAFKSYLKCQLYKIPHLKCQLQKATSKILTALKMTLNIGFLEEVQREEDKG
jgi:hypothetical protein